MSASPDSKPSPAVPPASSPYSSPAIPILLTVIILSFFCICFCLVYLCRCFMQNFLSTFYLRHYGPTIHTPVGTQSVNENGGLDPMIIQSFPTFTYSSVKEYRKEKFGLECAICLLEFEDIDVLRLMPICCHVFHQECIDPWLASHNTCPACRRVLDIAPVSKTPPNCSPLDTNRHSVMHESINEDDELSSMADQISITVKDDNDFRDQEENTTKSPACDKNTCFCAYQKFSRSNLTGHSISKKETVVEEDKFTLKLPEHVTVRIFRGHHWSQSCTSFGEYRSKSSSGNGGFGEVENCPSRSNTSNIVA